MIKDLKDIRKDEVNLFGGKATNLGFIIKNGFNVPKGFCISTKINEIDKSTKNEIIGRFQKLKSSVSVRSSATVEDSKHLSFAGQFDTFLNINSENKLLNSIKKCWNSIKSKRAIAYSKNKRIGSVKMAVIIQKMIQSDFAGVIFTVDPINKNDILIEITEGLGDKLVSGKITPISFFINRKTFNIKNKSGSLKINEITIKKLAKTTLQIEKLYNSPQDIEFAIKSNKIYILQARPITTLSKRKEKSELVFEKSITRDWCTVFAQTWHEVFTKEFRRQFGWGLTEIIYKVDKNCISVYRAPIEYIEGMKNLILDRLKKDSQWINKKAKEVQKQAESIIKWINIIKQKPYSLYDNKKLADILNKLIRNNVEIGPKYIIMFWFPIQMENMEKSGIYEDATLIARKTRKKIHILGAIVDKFACELVEEALKRAKLPSNLSKFTTYQEVLDYLRNDTLITKKELLKKKNGFIITKDGILFESVKNYLNKKGYPLKDEINVYKKTKLVFEKTITRDWGILFSQIFHKYFNYEFRNQYGWGYTEVIFEGKNNTVTLYRDQNEHAEGMTNFILKQIDANNSWMLTQAEKEKKHVKSLIAWVNSIKEKPYNNYTDKELLEILKTFSKKSIEIGPRFTFLHWFPINMENHEQSKKYKKSIDIAIKARVDVEKIVPVIGLFANEFANYISNKIKLSHKLFRFLTYEDITEYLINKKKPNISLLLKRQRHYIITKEGILFESLEHYLNREGYVLKQLELKGITEIKGQIAYPGIVRGRVKIIHSKEMFGKFNIGEILVTSMTTPDFVPLLKKSSAFVTDEGGITCHAAIISRELRIPCVIGTKIATKLLKDGDLIEVDANNGRVKIIKNR